MKIGLLGPRGTYTETALNKYNKDANKIFLKSHEEVFYAVMDGVVDEGIIAIENQINGFVLATIDLFLNSDMKIKNEIIIPIHHCLAKPKKTKIIENIISHPQALAQCHNYIKKNYPKIRKIPSESTSKGMEESLKIDNSAAIGPILAAKKFGLEIIDKKIEDYKGNETRFFIISKEYGDNKGQKTSIILRSKHVPGALYRCLSAFADNNVNLLNLFSRPIKNKSWEYSFYIELEGNVFNSDVKKSLKDIKKDCLELKILGSYGKP